MKRTKNLNSDWLLSLADDLAEMVDEDIYFQPLEWDGTQNAVELDKEISDFQANVHKAINALRYIARTQHEG